MSVLDLQVMESHAPQGGHDGGHDSNSSESCAPSNVSLALCHPSNVSLILC